MATDEQKRLFISQNMDSDLHYLLEDAGVGLDPQHAIAQLYRSVKHFSAFGDTRAEIRKACEDDFGLDAAASPQERSQIACVITAWETAQEFVVQENKVKAESRAIGVSKPLANTDRAAMRRALETAHGKKPDHEVPSAEYLAHKMEEIELNEMQADTLDEVVSMADSASTSLQSSLDTDGRIRVVKIKTKGTLPQNSDQLRTKYRVESNAWLMLSSKFRQKSWLNNFNPKVFEDFTDYILGPRVCGMLIPKSDGTDGLSLLQPPWAVVLMYEHELRKAALKLVREGTASLVDSMARVCSDTELKEIYFTSPIALSRSSKARSSSEGDGSKKQRTDPPERTSRKGDGKGSKGKGAGKGKNKNKVSLTSDVRQICYKFNNSTCPGNCGRVHVCQVRGCVGAHSMRDHGKSAGK